jgi:hypothetical protein
VAVRLPNGDYFLSAGIGDSVNKVFDFRYDHVAFTIPRLPSIQHDSVILESRFEFETLGSMVEDTQRER